MSRYLFLFIISLIGLKVFPQNKYEPQILIISPNNIKHADYFNKEINKLNAVIKKKSNQAEAVNTLTDQPENINAMMLNRAAYEKKLDFFKQLSSFSFDYLFYRFYERFPNMLIKLQDTICNGSLANLRKIANNSNLQYVLNFNSANLIREKGQNILKVNLELYDQVSDSLLLNKIYIGDMSNPGFEFSCKGLPCTLNNVLLQSLDDVINIIAIHSPTLIEERLLQKKRSEILAKEYLYQPFDQQKLVPIFEKDTTINLAHLYQVLFNVDSTKFVSFFLSISQPKDLKSLSQQQEDRYVKIISNKELRDKDALTIPSIYAYTVSGLTYNGKWYYDKQNVTYFEAENLTTGRSQFFANLLNLDFFKEKDTVFNEAFWEGKLFDRVQDLRKDKDWIKYGTSIWEVEEANNRDYIGLYKIVADKMKKEESELDTKFKNSLEIRFKNTYEKLKNDKSNKIKAYDIHSLIFSKNRMLAINPVLITYTDGSSEIEYFVAFADNGIYRWNYFSSTKIAEDNSFGSTVVDQLNTLTKWNFSYDYLNDANFWDKYVLLMDNNSYKYLKKID